ncbi:MAG: hypothetical protein WDN06_13665 [Asticcacaulis sp.]
MAELRVSGSVGESHFTTTREIRNLDHLNRQGSSSRVLNLARLYVAERDNDDYNAKPLFESSGLNRAIILKHTLRVDERHLFSYGRQTVTKIILPYDAFDLRLGGRAIYIRQQGYEGLMQACLGIDDMGRNRDVRILNILDALPSLDPFLVREHLSRIEVKPSRVYFQIARGDLDGMAAFTAERVHDLVQAALGESRLGLAEKLGEKILSDKLDQELQPLRSALGMTPQAFHEGVMCWRGYLYYKWCYVELQQGVRELLAGLSHYRANVTYDASLQSYLRRARPRIAKAVVKTLRDIGKTLEAYDDVYNALAHDRNPEPFRHFLLHGSHLFVQLGEKVGILNHMVSFWRFRMGKAVEGLRPLESIEFADILVDFEAGLSSAFRDGQPQPDGQDRPAA